MRRRTTACQGRAAPPGCGRRSDMDDGDPRRSDDELCRQDDLGGEKSNGDAREDGGLTLVVWVPSAWAELLRIDGGVAAELRPSGKKTRTAARHQAVPR